MLSGSLELVGAVEVVVAVLVSPRRQKKA